MVTAAVMVAVYFLGFRNGRKAPVCPVNEKVDTLFIRDTITEKMPIFVTRRVVDTMLVPVADTVSLHDTTYLMLEREQREYEDSLYHLWISGYRPQLDSLQIFRTEKVITITRTPEMKRWGVGIQAGFGASKDGLTPYVGVGVQLTLLHF